MNIRVFAYCTHAFTPVTDVTLPALRNYCARHGYSLVFHEVPYQTDRPIGFLITEAALQELRECDAMFVVNMDVLITNHTIRLESLMDEDHILFVTNDHNGLNLGTYLIRNGYGPLLVNVLRREGKGGITSEQDAMRTTLSERPDYATLTKILPQRAINSFLYTEYPETRGADEPGHWQPGDFILHLPARSNERRVELFTSPAIQEVIVR